MTTYSFQLPSLCLGNPENEWPPRTLRMKIGLVSNPHMPRFGKDLPAVLKQAYLRICRKVFV
jgi:hypothetical protein